MRTGTPIYTTREIIDETGFVMEVHTDNEDDADETAENDSPVDREPKLENYAIEELERTLEKLISEEQYEEAAKVSEIQKRKRGNQ